MVIRILNCWRFLDSVDGFFFRIFLNIQYCLSRIFPILKCGLFSIERIQIQRLSKGDTTPWF